MNSMDYFKIFKMNIFRLAGDMCHLFALFIILYKIIKTKSCAGVSGRSQILFAIVFIARYLDLLTTYLGVYNTGMKLIYIACTVTTVCLIYGWYRNTYEKEYDTFRAELLLIGAAAVALICNYQFEFEEVAWTFSIYLEAVAVLPQLFMVRKRGCCHLIACYLVALGLYRMLYILNWIFRYVAENHFDGISFMAGVIQTFILSTFICWSGGNKYKQLSLSDEEKAKPSALDFQLDEENRHKVLNYIQRNGQKQDVYSISQNVDSPPIKVHSKSIIMQLNK